MQHGLVSETSIADRHSNANAHINVTIQIDQGPRSKLWTQKTIPSWKHLADAAGDVQSQVQVRDRDG